MDDIHIMWGKTVPGNTAAYHPATYHMLDSGMVAQALLADGAPSRWRRVLATSLGLDEQAVMAGVPWLVSLHDLGKCSQAFQSMAPEQAARLRMAGVPFSRRAHAQPHPIISGAALPADPLMQALPEGLLRVLIEVAGGHHGRWLRPGQIPLARKQLGAAEPPFYAVARSAAAQWLYETLAAEVAWADPPDLSTAIMALTGFTILCDWLASDSGHFAAAAEVPPGEYVARSRAQAAQAMEDAGMTVPTESAAPAVFAALYPDKTPRPVQQAIDHIPADILSGPSLTVIEAPTGEGKTEAALALAHRIGVLRGCDAFYYALPTMATSNQMFDRVNTHLREQLRLPAGAKLVHGQANLMEDHLRVQPLANGEQDETASTLDWFTPRKRALLSPFGVGTIDQVELAVLNVRHVALRCAGLAGKTIIIDEVHAYDTYMTTIIERLLAWLRALGASVILLSATLPATRLRALAQAWGVEMRDDAAAAYPQIRVFGQGRAHLAAPRAHQPSRRIGLSWLSYAEDDAAGKAEWLLAQAGQGGCLCWITNTVGQAQALYGELKRRAPADLPLALIHSRFPLARREALEQQIMAAYGPKSPADRRGIVVGTQVLEQSLDLDFDVMVSDLAPIDLLLQRSGRLHRHERKGRPVAAAVLHVNLARDEAGAPDWGVNAVIYAEYVLRRTMQALETRSELELPGDFRVLVEAVYSAPPPTKHDDAALVASWESFEASTHKERGEARQRLVPMPDPADPFCAAIAGLEFQEDDNSARWGVAQTRLGAESVTLLPLERAGNACIVPGTGRRLSLSQAPDRETVFALLRQSVGVSHRAVVRHFEHSAAADHDGTEDGERPGAEPGGKLLGHPLLAHVRPLWLHSGRATLAGGRLRLELDDELGLVIDTERKENAE